MLQHEVDQLIVGPVRRIESQRVVRAAFLTQQRSNGDAHVGNQSLQLGAGRRRLEIFDDRGLDTGVADEVERVARRAARGIVIDRDGRHGSGPQFAVAVDTAPVLDSDAVGEFPPSAA